MGRFNLVLAVGGAASVVRAVTPVEKVIELLSKLSTQIADEGAKEAKAYDKYACFCKDQADGKLYSIEKSTEKIDSLAAKIEELTGEIDGLNSDISGLGTKIDNLATEIKDDTEAREAEHATYVVNEKDMSDAIDAIERAISSMAASKDDMEGNTKKGLALAQTKAVALAKSLSKMLGVPGEAAQYEYRSNDIIAVLTELKEKFTAKRNELDKDEFESNSAHDKKTLGNNNQKTFAEKEKSEKEAQVEERTERLKAAEEEKGEEENMKAADNEFMKVLTGDCEEKSGQFDQRTQTRKEEITAVTEAIATLKSGAKENYGANKKLSNLKVKQVVTTGHWVYVEDKKKQSFLQVHRNLKPKLPATAMEKVIKLLAGDADRLRSPTLSAIVLKAKLSEDHFVKVRGLIKDIIARLKADAEAEATTKGYCDKNMAEQVTARDEANSALEDLASQFTGKTSEKAQLKAEVAELSKEVAANAKALNEATELRTSESVENTETIEKAAAGKAAVEDAIEVLSKFYDAQGFVQKSSYTPPNADRSGKTVGDLAPAVFDDEYKGKQTESKGIIGMLEVILSDFGRTETTVTDEEAGAVTEHETYEADSKKDTDEKNKAIEEKEGKIVEATDKLVELEDEKKDQTKALELSTEELASLKKMCVDGTETNGERVAKREKEIASLKEAMTILDEWKN